MNREIFLLSNDVTIDKATEITSQIKNMSEGAGANQPIKMYINCYGGEIAAMFTILDAMNTAACDIYTVNLGEADSAAALIFSAGDRRFITENSRVMLHESRLTNIYLGTPLSQIEAELKELQIHNENMIKALAENTGKTAKEIKRDIQGKDLYLSAQEAIEYGLADEILTTEIKEQFDLKKADTKAGKAGVKPQEKRSKNMNKEELLSALKDNHGIDVAAIKGDLEKVNGEITALKAQRETLEAAAKKFDEQLSALKAEAAQKTEELEAVKKERAFDKIVAAGKEAVSVREDVLKAVKTAADIEAMYAKRPVIYNVSAHGKTTAADPSEIKDEATLSAIKEGHITEDDAKKYLNKKEDK
jgi:ATP-dependent Clp protease protease subunit